MSPINLHDFFPVTAGIRADTLPELEEHDIVKRSGPALCKVVTSELKKSAEFLEKLKSPHEDPTFS